MNAQAQATRTVKATLDAYADQVGSVNTRWVGQPTCDQQTVIFLNASGWENAETIHTFVVGAFDECKVTLSGAGFISIAWPGKAETEAHEMDRADRNAERYYRAARTVDLRAWLMPPVSKAASAADAWTRGRRTRQMQAELASREAELCVMPEHDHLDDSARCDVAAHVAAHLAMLTSRAVRVNQSDGVDTH
jgi:hypothetical protein